MAYVSERWGSFIHIPKTGGFWVRQVLKTLDDGYEDKVAHGLPEDWLAPCWAVVREPVGWLRSAWAHRVNEQWRPNTKEVPWRSFCLLIHPYRTSVDFPWFVERVTSELPGIVGWLFDCYTPPGVDVYVLGESLYEKLRGLGAEPDLHLPRNIGTNLPEMTGELREMIEKAEKRTYERYRLSQT